MLTHINNSVNNNFAKNSAQQKHVGKNNNFLPVVNLAADLPWLTNPVLFFSLRANRRLARLINYLATLANFNEVLYPTQDTISRNIDVSREWTSAIIARAVSLGLITKKWRAFTSCIYELHPIFNMLPFRQKLMKIMPALWSLPLVLLIALNSSDRGSRSAHLTLYIKGSPLYIKKPLPLHLRNTRKDTYDMYVYHTFVDKQNRKHITLYPKDPHRRAMEAVAMEQSIFRPLVMEIGKVLGLSAAGMCNISAYNDSVLSVSIAQMRAYSKRVVSPYGMLIKLCNTISVESHQLPDRSISYQLAGSLGVRLGIDPNVDESLPVLIHHQQREVYKYPNLEGKQFAAKSESFSSANTNTRPQKESFKGKWNLAKLGELNRHIDLSLASFMGKGMVCVPTPNHDTTYRATTPGEREIWNESRRLLLETEHGKAADAAGWGMPEAPMWFHGDCNVPASRNFIIQSDGSLTLSGMTVEQTRVLTTQFTRPLTEQEQQDYEWLEGYAQCVGEAPLWYEKICADVKNRADNLAKKLSLYRKTLEDSGVKIL